ncbi:MAG: hypothetical protein RLZZ61_1227 [Pseudomonadota bacterium]|jgi:hypothetical protein
MFRAAGWVHAIATRCFLYPRNAAVDARLYQQPLWRRQLIIHISRTLSDIDDWHHFDTKGCAHTEP